MKVRQTKCMLWYTFILKIFGNDISPFLWESLITLFWTLSGYVCPGFQRPGWIPVLVCFAALVHNGFLRCHPWLVTTCWLSWQPTCAASGMSGCTCIQNRLKFRMTVLLPHSSEGTANKVFFFKIILYFALFPKPWSWKLHRLPTHLETSRSSRGVLCTVDCAFPWPPNSWQIPFHGELSGKRLKVLLTWLVSKHWKRVVFLCIILNDY